MSVNIAPTSGHLSQDTSTNMKEVENLFFSVQTVLHLSYDPEKANSKANPDLSPEDLEALPMFCKNETAIMMTLYKDL